jgi:hypothetical protein
MKKCLKCECLYPDYYEKCPACNSNERKEWKKSNIREEQHNKEDNNIKNNNIFVYGYNDLKDIVESDYDE